MMEYFEAVQKRRSIRKFKAEPVPEAVINKALDAALLAPNSSNIQAWEFYWVRSDSARADLIKFCFGQSAARTSAELVVAVSRLDTWRRNRDLLLENFSKRGPIPAVVKTYYEKIVPLSYFQEPTGLFSIFKWFLFNVIGLFRSSPRGPITRADRFEVVTKSCALACENLMLALTAQGYDSCPMEGFDESRVRRLLKLSCHSRVVMVIGIGKADPSEIVQERFRIPRSLTVHEI